MTFEALVLIGIFVICSMLAGVMAFIDHWLRR